MPPAYSATVTVTNATAPLRVTGRAFTRFRVQARDGYVDVMESVISSGLSLNYLALSSQDQLYTWSAANEMCHVAAMSATPVQYMLFPGFWLSQMLSAPSNLTWLGAQKLNGYNCHVWSIHADNVKVQLYVHYLSGRPVRVLVEAINTIFDFIDFEEGPQAPHMVLPDALSCTHLVEAQDSKGDGVPPPAVAMPQSIS